VGLVTEHGNVSNLYGVFGAPSSDGNPLKNILVLDDSKELDQRSSVHRYRRWISILDNHCFKNFKKTAVLSDT
jgi:hypothetical protein